MAISKCITSWFLIYRSVLCMSWLLGIHFWVYRSSIKHSLPALSKDENCIIRYVFAKKLHPASCFSKYFLWLDHEIYISSHWKFLSFIIRPVINVWILQRLLNIFWHLFINFLNDNLNKVLEPVLGFETTLEVELKFPNTRDTSLLWNKPQPPQA